MRCGSGLLLRTLSYVIISQGFASLCGVGISTASADISIESRNDNVIVEAEGDSLLLILEKLGEQFGFTVKYHGLRESAPPFTGKRTGSLKEVIGSLLRFQDNVIIYQRDPSSETRENIRPKRIIVLMTSAAGPAPAVVKEHDSKAEDTSLPGVGERADTAPDADRRTRAVNDNEARRDIAYRSLPLPAVTTAVTRTKLSAVGQQLPDLLIDPSDADIKITVAIGNDQPDASYIMAHTPAGISLQQTAPGRWEPWDGQIDSLVDNGLKQSNEQMTFEIMQGDLTGEFYPLTFAVAYRTKDALKYGVFQAMPEQRSAQ